MEIINKKSLNISNIYFNNLDMSKSTQKIINWIIRNENKFITLSNTHSLSVVLRKNKFLRVINSSNMNLPDGMPIALYLSIKYRKIIKRVSGPDLMINILQKLPNPNIPIFLLGSTCDVLNDLKIKLSNQFGIKNIYIESPPFRELTEKENLEIINKINKFNSKLIFVSFGCPKQEEWIYLNKKKINGVLIGVGAAFLFHSNKLKRSPKFIQAIGFEWFFRLVQEPRRLFFRYLISFISFLIFIIKDIFYELKICIKQILS